MQNDNYVIDDENGVSFDNPSDAVRWYQTEITRLKGALTAIAAKHYTDEYHDGTSTGPDALKEIRAMANNALGKKH